MSLAVSAAGENFGRMWTAVTNISSCLVCSDQCKKLAHSCSDPPKIFACGANYQWPSFLYLKNIANFLHWLEGGPPLPPHPQRTVHQILGLSQNDLIFEKCRNPTFYIAPDKLPILLYPTVHAVITLPGYNNQWTSRRKSKRIGHQLCMCVVGVGGRAAL